MTGLERRTPLRRGAPLRRTGALVRRAPLRQKSEKRAALRPAEKEATAAMLDRDGHRCLLSNYGVGPCSGVMTPHHLEKQWKGWDWSLRNLVTLCSLHNEWVESAPDVAWALGLVVRNGETQDDAWKRMAERGLTSGRRR